MKNKRWEAENESTYAVLMDELERPRRAPVRALGSIAKDFVGKVVVVNSHDIVVEEAFFDPNRGVILQDNKGKQYTHFPVVVCSEC